MMRKVQAMYEVTEVRELDETERANVSSGTANYESVLYHVLSGECRLYTAGEPFPVGSKVHVTFEAEGAEDDV